MFIQYFNIGAFVIIILCCLTLLMPVLLNSLYVCDWPLYACGMD
jgi:hypothetical protein